MHPALNNFEENVEITFLKDGINFQDDLFPPTRVLWQSSCSGARWLEGELGAALWVGLHGFCIFFFGTLFGDTFYELCGQDDLFFSFLILDFL